MRTFEEVVAFAERQINLQMGAVSIIREDAQTLLSTIRDRDKTIAELRDTNQTLRESVSAMFGYTSVCPMCREYGRTGKHGDGCELARALGEVG